MKPIKVLVVDDTIVFRKIVSDILSEVPGVEVVGTANNGKVAVSKIQYLQPDLLTLDIEMPTMNGLQVLEYIQENTPHIGAIVLSTLTQEGSDMTIRALELGAFDFIPKPQSGTMNENRENVQKALLPMVKAFSRSRHLTNILRGKTQAPAPARSNKTQPQGKPSLPVNRPPLHGKTAKKEIPATKNVSNVSYTGSEIVAIGISTGGPNALSAMMPQLPENIGIPIVIVQHMPPIFTESLAKSLNSKCHISVKEAKNGDRLLPNTAMIAPGGKQMKIIASGDGKNRLIKITDDPPENSCKPSADYLFRSVASHYIGRATGVIMTGMGSDGCKGLRKMKDSGSFIIAQNEETCTVYGMPKEPIESNIVDVIAPLNSIAEEILKTIKKTR